MMLTIPPLGRWGDACIVEAPTGALVLSVDGVRVMSWHPDTRREEWELLGQAELGTGHVICTGLGLGIREQLLLAKPDVTRLTVLERSAGVIQMHRETSGWMADSRVEVIQCDAENYNGTCDWLLIDHCPDGLSPEVYLGQWQRMGQGIAHCWAWPWPIELVLWWKMRREPRAGLLTHFHAMQEQLELQLPDMTEERLARLVAVAAMEKLEPAK